MSVLASFGATIAWMVSLVAQLLRVRWGLAATVIGSSVIARITRMLTFLLPLKIILLAGSDGVPRYFQVFLSPEHKSEGVIVLSVAAILFYAVTLILESRVRRLSERGSAELLTVSGTLMAVVANQRDQAQGFYTRITQVAADLIFVMVGLICLGVLDPGLVAWLAGLSLCFFGLTAWTLHRVTPLRRTWLSDFITERLGTYLSVLSSVAFLSAFLVILYPFLTGQDRNILFAIISVVLLRRVLSALTGSIRDMTALAGQRELVDTMVFPDRRLQLLERKDQRTLRELFGRKDRERVIAEELSEAVGPDRTLHVEWRDPPMRSMGEFAIALRGADGEKRHLRQWVFPSRLRHMLENEDLLFAHIERDAVGAPPVARRFMRGEHECVVYEAGEGITPSAREWERLPAAFLADLWSVEPPPALVKIYTASHRYLHERLSDDFVARLDIAVGSDAEAAAMARFADTLDALRRSLAALPLCLVNPGIERERTVMRSDGGAYLFGWGSWSLEPAGAGLNKLVNEGQELERLIEVARRRRPALDTAVLAPRHLAMANRSAQLEQAILRGNMKAGLKIATRILADMKALGGAESGPVQAEALARAG